MANEKSSNSKKIIIAIVAVVLVVAVAVGIAFAVKPTKDEDVETRKTTTSTTTVKEEEPTTEQLSDSVKAEIDRIYNSNKSAYDMVDFRIYDFENEKLAEDFLATITDEVSFLAKVQELNKDVENYDADMQTNLRAILKAEAANFSNELAEWLFAPQRKVGDKSVFVSRDGSTCSVVFVTATPHQIETVSVRHILFMTADPTTGVSLSADEVAKKKAEAEKTLETWKKGEKTSESFGDLATKLTEDTGSKYTGGLYENIRPGTMIKEFDEWIFDKNRKPGDVDIVETDYGYHVMYFEKNDGKYYESVIKNQLDK